LFAGFAAILAVAGGLKFAPIAIIDCVAVLELLQRDRSREGLKGQVLALLPAAAYLFVGLVLAFTYTNVIVRLRFFCRL
jgi:hypothetical protein